MNSTVTWTLLKNGIGHRGGHRQDASCAPLTRARSDRSVQAAEAGLSGDEYYLDLSVRTKKAGTDMVPAGTEVAYGQIALSGSGTLRKVHHGTGSLEVVDHPDMYVPVGTDFSFSIDKGTGLMKSYTYKGETLITDGPRPNFWRGNVENDTGWGYKGVFDTAWEHAANKINVKGIDVKDGADGQKIVTSHLTLPNAGNTSVTITYTDLPERQCQGRFHVDATRAGLGNFLRVGSMMTLPEAPSR